MEAEIIKAILQNAAALSGVTVAILGALGFVILLLREKLYLPATFKDRNERCTKCETALEAANLELVEVRTMLTRLQVEKEFGWRQRPRAPVRKAKQ